MAQLGYLWEKFGCPYINIDILTTPPTFIDIDDGALSSVGNLQGCDVVDAANIQVMDGKEVVDLVDEHSWMRVTTEAGKRKLPVCVFHVSHFCICYETQTWIVNTKGNQQDQ